MKARGAFTLVELLVAIALTSLVGIAVSRWIVHEARSSTSSERRIAASEAVNTLRTEMFQDVHHGRILYLSKERWAILRHGAVDASDTVVWELRDGAVSRRRSGGAEGARLTGFQGSSVEWSPVAVPEHSGSGRDPWWSLDADQDGRIEGSELDSVLQVSVRVLAEFRTLAGMPSARESLTILIPAAGL
jgi:hypothetical protein